MREPDTPPHLNLELSSPVQLELELKLDFQLLASEIIRHLRKDVSQRELSEKLGYSFNQVGKWESQATQIKLSDFILLAKALRIPIEKHFRESFWLSNLEFDSSSIVKALDTLINFKSLENKRFQKNLSKWLKGNSEPDFVEVLMILGTKSPILLGWLSKFVDCSDISLLSETYQDFLKTIDVVLADPNVCLLLAALRLEAYKNLEFHDEGFLAVHAACSVDQVESGLRLLESQGLVSFQNNKFWPHAFDLSFPNLHSPKLRGFHKYVLQLTTNRYPTTPIRNHPEKTYNPAMSSVRTVALSAEAAGKLAHAISQFHVSVGEIVKQDQNPKDAVQIILIQSFPTNFDQ